MAATKTEAEALAWVAHNGNGVPPNIDHLAALRAYAKRQDDFYSRILPALRANTLGHRS